MKEENPFVLYKHNEKIYKKITSSFSKQNVVGVIECANGGKSYLSLHYVYDNKDKNIIYLVPSLSKKNKLERLIKDANLDMSSFPNLEIRTYQSLINLSEVEIESLPCEILILSDFYHLSAPVWQARVNTLIKTHPNIKILGGAGLNFSEKEMINADGSELFAGNIVAEYSIEKALADNVLPQVYFKGIYNNLSIVANELIEKVNIIKNKELKEEYLKILNDVFKKLPYNLDKEDLIKKNIAPDYKIVYLMAPDLEKGKSDAYLQEIKSYLNKIDVKCEPIYYTVKGSSEEDLQELELFKNNKTKDGHDVTGRLRVLILKSDISIHIEDVKAVILGSYTDSYSSYKELLALALGIRGTNYEKSQSLAKLTKKELLALCQEQDILISPNITKEEIIKMFLSPLIIDLRNTPAYIKTLKQNKEDFLVTIEGDNEYEMLRYISDCLIKSWEDYYNYAKIYYEHHHNLKVARSFKTINGYEYLKDGTINLGEWLYNQRTHTNPNSEHGKLLEQIGMDFHLNKRHSWDEYYALAQIFYEHYGNLEIPKHFVTNNGYEKDINGEFKLGSWLFNQRASVNVNSKRGKMLRDIGMRFTKIRNFISDEEYMAYAKKYKEVHGNVDIPFKFKTNNGYEYDKNGRIALGVWAFNKRKKALKNNKAKEELEVLGLNIEGKRIPFNIYYQYAKKYYEENNNLEIPYAYQVKDNKYGLINLGAWLSRQRRANLSYEKRVLLEQIGMRFTNIRNHVPFPIIYQYLENYYNEHHNLNIPVSYTIESDDYGIIKLGSWLFNAKHRLNPDSEKGKMLQKIGFSYENRRLQREKIDKLCLVYNIDKEKNSIILNHLTYEEMIIKINYLKSINMPLLDNLGLLQEIFSMSKKNIKEKYGLDLDEYLNKECQKEKR